jgi:hypothetical protein
VTLVLPLRVHLLQSPASPHLTTTRREQDITTLLSVANAIWQAAQIQWVVSDVTHETAPAPAIFDSLVAGTAPATRDRLLTIAPRDSLLDPGWNLFLIREFGQIAGGAYQAGWQGVVLAERGMGVDLPASGRGGATLAHELGHSLGLAHVPCDSTRNIMALGCWAPSARSSLTSSQIVAARSQAATGRPGPDIR